MTFESPNGTKVTAYEDFCKYMQPICGEGKLLDIWYDRNINAGDDFWDEIEEHLAERDIVCLFLSKEYLSSSSCVREMKKAIQMHDEKGTLVITIILSKCAWRDADVEIPKLLSATKDAKEIDHYEFAEDGWDEVFNSIKEAASKYQKIKDLQVSSKFNSFLNDATLLSKAHFNKNTITLNDIFVYQDLTKIEVKEDEKRDNVENVLNNFKEGTKIVFVGDDQSGKTTILKKAFEILRSKNFIPIYIKDPEELLQGNIVLRIAKIFNEQYCTKNRLEEYDKNKIVPLLDDFHKANKKEKLLEKLNRTYKSCILIVDEIFRLDIIQEQMVVDFNKYRIRELKPSLRNKLIRHWLSIREGDVSPKFSNEELEQIDRMTNLVDQSLGKTFGSGIMPAHPFFILYVLSAYEFEMPPTNSVITSQGHCYQALITLFLRNNGVAGDLIDGYLNFFTEFAHAIYVNKGRSLNCDTYENFLKYYESNFNYVESKNTFLRKAYSTNIIVRSSLGSYEFGYPYLYYFFAGKYFSEQWDDKEAPNHIQSSKEVDTIIENLHKTSNAYIAIFISYHTKNKSFLSKLSRIADGIYSKFEPSKLDANDLEVFNHQSDKIAAPIISSEIDVEKNRQRALEIRDDIEDHNESEVDEYSEENGEEFAKEIRRAMKTVEVIGTIIKNRAGSLLLPQLKRLFETGVNVHLRFLSSFLAIVKEIVENKDDPNYSDFLIDRIENLLPNDMSYSRKQIIANRLFWRMNFAFIISLIQTTTKSLGSKKLSSIITDVCNEINTPATYLIKHNVSMWCNKNLQVDELMNMDKVLDSYITRMAMRWLIAGYCNMHNISYKDKPKLHKLGISKYSLISKNNDNRNKPSKSSNAN